MTCADAPPGHRVPSGQEVISTRTSNPRPLTAHAPISMFPHLLRQATRNSSELFNLPSLSLLCAYLLGYKRWDNRNKWEEKIVPDSSFENSSFRGVN